MAKKPKPESEEQHRKRFKKDARNLVDDGRLDPVEAETLLNASSDGIAPD